MLVRTWHGGSEGKYHFGVVTPDCCKEAQEGMAITLQLPDGAWNHPELGVNDVKPEWKVGSHVPYDTLGLLISAKGMQPYKLTPKYCPYCGAGLPEIVKNPDPPEPLYTRVGGDECGTCGTDSPFPCGCLRPETAWMPAPDTKFWDKLEGQKLPEDNKK